MSKIRSIAFKFIDILENDLLNSFIGLIGLFGFVLSCLILLLVINVIANKYLRGDYAKVDEDNEDDVYGNEDDEDDVTNGNTKTSPYCEISPDKMNQNTPGVTLSLRYYQSTRTIEGVVKSLINPSHIPSSLIRFNAWCTAHKKYSGKTKTENTKNNVHVMALSFVIKPVVYEDLLNSSLCLQVQGKEKVLTRKWKAYGECYIPLNEIVGKADGVEFSRKLLPVSFFIKE